MDLLKGQPQLITVDLFTDLIAKAAQSPRKRINHNFHASAADNPHRFLNVFLRGSYVTPHRHSSPAKTEAFLVLEGHMAAFLFDDAGHVRSSHLLGSNAVPSDLPVALLGCHPCVGIDLPAGVWHTVTALTLHAVCYEVKPGPWEPATDKDFAPWAPREGDPGAAEYLEGLLRTAVTS